ncbi:hypothetical protein KAU33_05200 [Candidatus Dependentiae bacterium]|nr:hypothetical protein [Candidatus Dependentiae bacterium]
MKTFQEEKEPPGKIFKIFIDSTGKIHLPLDFPNKEGFINSIPNEGISEKLKKSGDFCG